mmetsp:Transcript_15004/g.62476  ORF Transcript_15004/g.62476 Transcript_15004/m.62476 type:complete len:422 (-) Transcript_15004:193-1458(-)
MGFVGHHLARSAATPAYSSTRCRRAVRGRTCRGSRRRGVQRVGGPKRRPGRPSYRLKMELRRGILSSGKGGSCSLARGSTNAACASTCALSAFSTHLPHCDVVGDCAQLLEGARQEDAVDVRATDAGGLRAAGAAWPFAAGAAWPFAAGLASPFAAGLAWPFAAGWASPFAFAFPFSFFDGDASDAGAGDPCDLPLADWAGLLLSAAMLMPCHVAWTVSPSGLSSLPLMWYLRPSTRSTRLSMRSRESTGMAAVSAVFTWTVAPPHASPIAQNALCPTASSASEHAAPPWAYPLCDSARVVAYATPTSRFPFASKWYSSTLAGESSLWHRSKPLKPASLRDLTPAAPPPHSGSSTRSKEGSARSSATHFALSAFFAAATAAFSAAAELARPPRPKTTRTALVATIASTAAAAGRRSSSSAA